MMHGSAEWTAAQVTATRRTPRGRERLLVQGGLASLVLACDHASGEQSVAVMAEDVRAGLRLSAPAARKVAAWLLAGMSGEDAAEACRVADRERQKRVRS